MEKLEGLGDLPATERFGRMLVQSMEPIRLGVINNIHSVTGRTVSAVVSGMGRGAKPSAFVKVDKTIAFTVWRGKAYPYPYAVESGHGKAPAYPFFRNAVNANRSMVRSLVNEGSRDVLMEYVHSPQTGGEFA